ncbi:glycosyltransferase family 2 protein, partial [Patescibacteria group bacterium]|nr:glycosyltransferase family 2 protein [Patescibacteria group bacterium]
MTPTVTFIIPTLNAGSVLKPCLKSIKNQTYKNYQIIIADGGSNDDTLKIAQKYKAQIIKNPLKTAEAGKAIAVKKCTTKLVCLLDSDNILPNSNWLKQMMAPFSDPAIIGSEPWAFTYRPRAGFIERYSALIGANDPYAFVIGVSDRINYFKPPQNDHPSYIKLTLNPKQTIPTIGANGTIFKTNFIKKNLKSKYLFDIDIITQVINQTQKPLY